MLYIYCILTSQLSPFQFQAGTSPNVWSSLGWIHTVCKPLYDGSLYREMWDKKYSLYCLIRKATLDRISFQKKRSRFFSIKTKEKRNTSFSLWEKVLTLKKIKNSFLTISTTLFNILWSSAMILPNSTERFSYFHLQSHEIVFPWGWLWLALVIRSHSFSY